MTASLSVCLPANYLEEEEKEEEEGFTAIVPLVLACAHSTCLSVTDCVYMSLAIHSSFGLYLTDLFQARCITHEATKRTELVTWHSILVCMIFGAPYAFVSNR